MLSVSKTLFTVRPMHRPPLPDHAPRRWDGLVWSRILSPHRVAIAIGLTLVLSLRVVFDPASFQFLTPAELSYAAARHALELFPLSAGMLLVYGLADELLPPNRPWRLIAVVGIIVAATAVLSAIYFFAIWGLSRARFGVGLLTQTVVWSVPGVFCALISEADRRARRVEAQVLFAGAEQARLVREEAGYQLQVLQAQIEPHFLFNTLANLRRLYRTQPEAGARMFERLQCYLQSAMPQLRRRRAPLGDELVLVEAYLGLFKVRMAERLQYAINVPADLRVFDFPPVLLLTLVENALKHGLDPKPGGGRIEISARKVGSELWVEVVDDGVGFGGASTGGTGVGLVNIRRRLATLHGERAGLDLAPRAGGGVIALVRLPAEAYAPGTPDAKPATCTA